MFLYSEKIYTPQGFVKGYIKIVDGKIHGIYEDTEGKFIDYKDKVIVPGFIDIHIHGWATGSFWYEGTEKSLENMSKELVKIGVTSYLATTGTDALDYIKSHLVSGKAAIDNWKPEKGSQVLGFHLEGPFINKEFKGMQKEEHCINPSIEILEDFFQSGGKENVKLITIAPELEGSLEFIKYVNKEGIQVSVGHSAAEFEDIRDLKDYGLGGFTHTFSGMRGFHHRRLGVAGAAMYFDDMYAEFAKQTGKTVSHEAFKIMFKLKGPEGILLSSDSTGLAHVKEPFHHYIRKCTFRPDGEYVNLVYDEGISERINKYDYEKVKNLELSYLDSVKNIINNVNASIGDIAKIASENPAKYIGVYDKKGSIEVGKDADLLVIDSDWNLQDVFLQGIKQELD
ncbi:N-acetylglucosamine-6-phosphate deacetylase [Alkaliphilus peptidifermentans]|uniref:N-acetylglucosamine-6-phosphate deacetylase n=1 Tax=Alkaliphilus peptidifermentans DSM 18978 TaxID=1120976 RepID=A0A1G5INA7_9FIRM|nr:N-acetylglucosamine-6-phosphate deacetylase [Alkaliphilus peptidifermentans]SCY77069.1 N-acetylglucosamine-6-phosphate deacetylase [Alkaliphilus peptidifermentans DSM 18978]